MVPIAKNSASAAAEINGNAARALRKRRHENAVLMRVPPELEKAYGAPMGDGRINVHILTSSWSTNWYDEKIFTKTMFAPSAAEINALRIKMKRGSQ
ncbi:MAG: hypothetical protein LBU76_09725 [Azoarcus sp.]|jgi:hypothetical protein|nr:hypothetical protein [Azoarcus sp.]